MKSDDYAYRSWRRRNRRVPKEIFIVLVVAGVMLFLCTAIASLLHMPGQG